MEFPKINVSSKADIQYLADIWRTNLYANLEKQHGNIAEVQPLLDQVTKEWQQEWQET